MPITNKIFIDSSVLIEALKGSKTALLEKLFAAKDNELFINDVVVSEFMFHFLAVNNTVSPLTLKMKAQIAETLKSNSSFSILEYFSFLPSDKQIVTAVPLLMEKYNLLPNDAMIIFCCKLNNINQLAS